MVKHYPANFKQFIIEVVDNYFKTINLEGIWTMNETLPEHYKQFMNATGGKLSGSRGIAMRYVEDCIVEKLSTDDTYISKSVSHNLTWLLRECVNSDWDIVVQESDETIAAYNKYFCQNNLSQVDPMYADSNTTRIGTDIFVSNGIKHKVDIIFKKDLNKYLKMFDQITPEFYANHLWKKSSLYNLYEDIDIRPYVRAQFDMLYNMLETNYDG